MVDWDIRIQIYCKDLCVRKLFLNVMQIVSVLMAVSTFSKCFKLNIGLRKV